MYKKKTFDRDIGEVRECRVCKKEWHTFKPVWRCQACVIKTERERREDVKLYGIKNKAPYPFSNTNGDASRRFFKIQKELKEAWKLGKDAVKAHYQKQFDEIEANGILEWIYDRRGKADKKPKGLRDRRKHHDTIDNYISD